jgi:hypothetical protein
MRLHETKRLLNNKGNVTSLKTQPTEWEKIFASYTSNKELINKMYRELKKFSINNALNKWANELNRQFSEKEVQMANKHMMKFSTSLAIKEMQIKMTLRFHHTLVKMTIINNTNNNKCWRRCGGKETLLTVDGKVN